MSELVSFNGVVYTIPDVDDEGWGQNVTDFLVAIPAGCLQKTGGAFTLTADANFGASFGLVSAYFKSRSSNIASAGAVRLSPTDLVEWRKFAGGGNNTLGVNASDQLVYNGSPLEFNALADTHIFVGNASNVATDVAMSGDIGISNAGVTAIQSGVIVNADINASAAIAYTKLNLTGSIVNADIYSSAAIAYSKLNLTGTIVNADINASAAIAYSKLNLATSIVNADINATAAIAYSKLSLTGSIVNTDVNASAAIAYSKLNLANSVSLTGDVTGTLAVTHGGTGLATLAQGDLLYGSAANTLSALAKSTSATRYLANTGTSNNPAWGQVGLTDGVTGTLPVANGGTGVTASTGTVAVVLSTSPTLVTPILGIPTSGTLSNCTGLPLTSGVTGTLPVGNGGTGQTSYTDGQLLIGRTDTGLLSKATLTGTANQVVVTNGTAAITLSTPQSIGTGSSPTFAGLTLSSPLTVANGGTGDATLTAYAVLCGGTTTTGAVQSVAGVGSSGQVLTSNGASALPTFQSVSGSGTVNSGTTPRLAFYAATGTAVSSISADASMNSQKITSLANGTASTDAAAFGQIKYLQMVFATTTTRTNTTSTSFVDTNLTATITPTSASNRIKVSVCGTLDIGGAASQQALATIKRGSTNIGDANQGLSFYSPASSLTESEVPCSMLVIDSPATTSATTYTVQIKSSSNTATAKWIADNSLSTICLEEIV